MDVHPFDQTGSFEGAHAARCAAHRSCRQHWLGGRDNRGRIARIRRHGATQGQPEAFRRTLDLPAAVRCPALHDGEGHRLCRDRPGRPGRLAHAAGEWRVQLDVQRRGTGPDQGLCRPRVPRPAGGTLHAAHRSGRRCRLSKPHLLFRQPQRYGPAGRHGQCRGWAQAHPRTCREARRGAGDGAAQLQGRSSRLPVRPLCVGCRAVPAARLGQFRPALRHLPHADHGGRHHRHHRQASRLLQALPHRRRARPERDRRPAGAPLSSHLSRDPRHRFQGVSGAGIHACSARSRCLIARGDPPRHCCWLGNQWRLGGEGADREGPEGPDAGTRAQHRARQGLRQRDEGGVGFPAPQPANAGDEGRLPGADARLRPGREPGRNVGQRTGIALHRDQALRLVPWLPRRWSFLDVGAAELSLLRSGFRGQPQGRHRHRLADPLRRHRAVVRPRGEVRRHRRHARRTGRAAGRRVPAADSPEHRREGCGRAHQEGLRRNAAHDPLAHCQHHPADARAGARELPVPQQVHPGLSLRCLFLDPGGDAASGDEDRQSDLAAVLDRQGSALRQGPQARARRGGHRCRDRADLPVHGQGHFPQCIVVQLDVAADEFGHRRLGRRAGLFVRRVGAQRDGPSFRGRCLGPGRGLRRQVLLRPPSLRLLHSAVPQRRGRQAWLPARVRLPGRCQPHRMVARDRRAQHRCRSEGGTDRAG